MEVSIEYCALRNYLPRASRLAARITRAIPGAQVTLVKARAGNFVVTADGRMIWDALERGDRLPEEREILDLLGGAP